MRPKKPSSELELFQSHLDQILDHEQPLFRLARQIDWGVFERAFEPLYHPGKGRPGLPIRLLVGLHYLKHAFNESDESVVEHFVQNPYWQYFCGEEYFCHEFPIDRSLMTKWRNRLKSAGLEKLLESTIVAGLKTKVLKRTSFQRLNVDTTVQEYPFGA